jgi:uncharacterized protein
MEYKVILKALVGSHLYGLNHENSDKDYNGIFVAPTYEILGFNWNQHKETVVTKDPDTTLHEVHKFMRLAMQGNPTVLELLYCPEYEILTYEGELLVEYRDFFLSNRIRDSYGGYAYQQAKKLQQRTEDGLEGFNPAVKNRYAKHARHCFRLLRQGRELMERAGLNPVLPNVEDYFALGNLPVDELVKKFEEEYEIFLNTESKLPEQPNIAGLNAIINRIRSYNP